jgi:hypothetical protein
MSEDIGWRLSNNYKIVIIAIICDNIVIASQLTLMLLGIYV